MAPIELVRVHRAILAGPVIVDVYHVPDTKQQKQSAMFSDIDRGLLIVILTCPRSSCRRIRT